jgi:hypothetical protein
MEHPRSMSTSQVRDDSTPQAEDGPIAEYLKRNPDFFVRNEGLLARLRLPHARGSATVSLVERQVEVLRTKNHSLEEKLVEFVKVARANDALAEKIHRFTRLLMAAQTRAAVIGQIEKSLREDFETFHAVLVLFGPVTNDLSADRFVSLVEPGNPNLAGFESLFQSGKPRCGQVRDSQRDFLFGVDGGGIASLALLPLGGKTPFGLLALGSTDRDRFHPGMNIDFLGRMGELVADALLR